MTKDTEALREAGEYLITLLNMAVRGKPIRDMDEAIGAFRRAALATPASDVAPVAWLGPIPHSGGQKPEWLPDQAIVMIAFNPRDSQTRLTWEFAAKRKAPAKDRDWEHATAFCVETPLAQSVDPVAGEALREALIAAGRVLMSVEDSVPAAKDAQRIILAALQGPAA